MSVYKTIQIFGNPFHRAQGNHLYNFGRKHYGEHMCEIILKFGPVAQEMLPKRYFLFIALLPFCSASEAICATLVGGIVENICEMKSF